MLNFALITFQKKEVRTWIIFFHWACDADVKRAKNVGIDF